MGSKPTVSLDLPLMTCLFVPIRGIIPCGVEKLKKKPVPDPVEVRSLKVENIICSEVESACTISSLTIY